MKNAPETRGNAKSGEKILDWLFGYDYFIAHRSADGKEYASALYDALTAKGNELDCFLDVKHYGAGGGLTNMQARALRKTSRLLVVVTPHSHDDDAIYLQNEVAEFRRLHPGGTVVPIGSKATLSRDDNPNSRLLPILLPVPDIIYILEADASLRLATPSQQTVGKLLNDFSEERRSTKRLRWIRRAAMLLLFLLVGAVGMWIYASFERANAVASARAANRQLGKADWLIAEQARDQRGDMIGAALFYAHGAEAFEKAHELSAARNATIAAKVSLGWSSLEATLPHNQAVNGAIFGKDEGRVLTWGKDGYVRLWTVGPKGQELLQAFKHGNAVAGAIFSGDESKLLTWGENGAALLWAVGMKGSDQAPLQRFDAHLPDPISIQGATFCQQDTQVLIWFKYGPLLLWPLTSGATEAPKNLGILVVVMNKAKTRLLACNDDGSATLWDMGVGGLNEIRRFAHSDVAGGNISDDGTQVLTWGEDGTARLWLADTKEDKPVQTFSHWQIKGAAFSNDGSSVLTWGGEATDCAVRVWKTRGRGAEPVETIKYQSIAGAVFSPDGSQVLSWGSGTEADLWPAENAEAQPSQTYQHKEPVNNATFTKDGKFILTSTGNPLIDGGTVQLWSVDAGDQAPVRVFAHKDEMMGAIFNKDESRVLTWSRDGTAQVWTVEAAGAAPLQSFDVQRPHGGILLKDQSGVLLWGRDSTARLWQVGKTSNNLLQSFEHKGPIVGVKFNEEENRLLTWSADGTAKLWSIGDRHSPQIFEHGKSVVGAKFTRDEKRVLTWSKDGTARLWAVGATTASPLQTFDHQEPVAGAAFSEDESRLVTWGGIEDSNIGHARLWVVGANGRSPLQTFTHQGVVNGVAFMNNGKRLMTWSHDGAVSVWPVGAGAKPLQTLRHQGPVYDAVLDKNERRVLTWSKDSPVFLWAIDIDRTKPLRSFEQSGQINQVIFNKDRSRVLTISTPQMKLNGVARVRLWDVNSSATEPLQSFEDGSLVLGAAFNKDESRVLTWNQDGGVRLWAVGTGGLAPIQVFDNKTPITGAALSLDETQLLTWGGYPDRDDGVAQLWSIPAPAAIPAAEGILDLEVQTDVDLYGLKELRFMTFDEWQVKKHELDRLQVELQKLR